MKEDFLRYNNDLKRIITTVIIIVMLPFVFGTIGFMIAKGIDLKDAFLLTIETLSFLGERKEAGASFVIQVLLLVVGLVAVWTALAEIVSFIVEGKFSNYFREARQMNNLKKLKDHVIICGGGRIGERVAEGLLKKRKKFVVIEKDSSVASFLEKKNYLVILADALHEDVLEEAGIKRASVLVSVLAETEKNVLVVLTAREINPDVYIYARSDSAEYTRKLRKAGANQVVVPEISSAEEIIRSI